MANRRIACAAFAVMLLGSAAASLGAEQPATKNMWPLFAFDNGVGRGKLTPAEQAALVKRLGYDGISYNYNNTGELKERIDAFREAKLPVFAVYMPTNLDKPGYFAPEWRETVKLLKGSDTMLWLLVAGGKYKQDDDKAVELVQAAADLAAEAKLRVAIYPHQPDYIKSTEDALRVLARVDRKNVGVTMNLCHEWLAGKGDEIPQTIRKAAKHLLLVSINGADVPGKGKRSVLPLGDGEFDVLPVLQTLREVGYRGPVGLQCWSVPGDQEENLKRSLAAWRKYQAALAEKQ